MDFIDAQDWASEVHLEVKFWANEQLQTDGPLKEEPRRPIQMACSAGQCLSLRSRASASARTLLFRMGIMTFASEVSTPAAILSGFVAWLMIKRERWVQRQPCTEKSSLQAGFVEAGEFPTIQKGISRASLAITCSRTAKILPLRPFATTSRFSGALPGRCGLRCASVNARCIP